MEIYGGVERMRTLTAALGVELPDVVVDISRVLLVEGVLEDLDGAFEQDMLCRGSRQIHLTTEER